MKRSLLTIVFMTACVYTGAASAAPCRMAEAAIKGSQSGYERDTTAAIETAEKDMSASDVLGKCVGGISAVVNAPTFPSLSALFDQVFDRVCRAARNEVQGAVRNANGQIGDLTSGVDLYGAARDVGIGNVNAGVDIHHSSDTGVDIDTRNRKSSWLNLFR